ncbi:uncharacterized protein EAE98_004877 [Botrytis deweyae]|uniref:Uncharacterized protein n=1 Tax=Botrytis deweyae TaxID=2478750 RepID=A0ABQ7IPK0_9HELO|nr:uncharacterized protein EAE98_004877 [Botrytis deweyae]KAF7930477.1 hypothetical protein EAE98_004877 [Botrytis deweyae]
MTLDAHSEQIFRKKYADSQGRMVELYQPNWIERKILVEIGSTYQHIVQRTASDYIFFYGLSFWETSNTEYTFIPEQETCAIDTKTLTALSSALSNRKKAELKIIELKERVVTVNECIDVGADGMNSKIIEVEVNAADKCRTRDCPSKARSVDWVRANNSDKQRKHNHPRLARSEMNRLQLTAEPDEDAVDDKRNTQQFFSGM